MAAKTYQIGFAGSAVDDPFYGDVVSLSVEEAISSAGSFHLQLATRLLDDGTWQYLDDGRLALFTKVSIKIGFTGGGGTSSTGDSLTGGGAGDNGLKTVFDGYITSAHLNLGSEPANTYIDVTGMDGTVLMGMEEKIATWPNMTDSDIVTQIAGQYGVSVKADKTSTMHRENDTTVVQRGSDLQFVRELAHRNGMEFYLESDDQGQTSSAFFRAPQLDGSPQQDLAIQAGDQSNLRSFSAHLSGQRPLNTKSAQLDVKSNSLNIVQVSDTTLAKIGASDANSLIGGPLGSLVTPKDAQAQMQVLGSPTSDATELKTMAQAVRDEAGWLILATGEINSEAYQAVLRPRRLVQVKGAGRAHSGKYYVTRVTHEIRHDGAYTQKFEARRNARDLQGSEKFGDSGQGVPIPGANS